MYKPTQTVYYEDVLLSSCEATILKVSDDYIILDKTVAFPEGGGQEGDKGVIKKKNGEIIEFIDTQKGMGRPIYLNDFPVINVDTEIKHFICNSKNLNVGDKVVVEIDVERRERLTISHSASHFLFLGVKKINPEATNNVKGCHITENQARFDFSVTERFTPEHINEIELLANGYVERDSKINTYSHTDEPHAIYWECEGEIIPCGGTHLQTSGSIGRLKIKRKNIGKGKERLIVTFDDAVIDIDKYHK